MEPKEFNLYVDESCHLEKDGFDVMAIGYVKVPKDKIDEYKKEIKSIKLKHGVPQEVKWNTISNTKVQMYEELIDFFFASEMEFRYVLVINKNKLDNASYNDGEHDNFYYKTVYFLLHNDYINCPRDIFKVYLDIKDTRGKSKLNKINEVLNNTYHCQSPFKYFQHIRSYESQFIQLTDLFIGAAAYKGRKLDQDADHNKAKVHLIKYIEEKAGYELAVSSTVPWEKKFNQFMFQL